MAKTASLDVGLKRIGVAYTPDEKVIVPLEAIQRKNRNQAARDVVAMLKEWQIEKLIVGIPHTNEETTRRIKHFISLLEIEIEIIYVDESFSSFEVEEMIKGEIRHKRDGRIDSLAAKVILERYLKL